ncbi:unnamed protein product, partial [Amoebophrya sp. A25]
SVNASNNVKSSTSIKLQEHESSSAFLKLETSEGWKAFMCRFIQWVAFSDPPGDKCKTVRGYFDSPGTKDEQSLRMRDAIKAENHAHRFSLTPAAATQAAAVTSLGTESPPAKRSRTEPIGADMLAEVSGSPGRSVMVGRKTAEEPARVRAGASGSSSSSSCLPMDRPPGDSGRPSDASQPGRNVPENMRDPQTIGGGGRMTAKAWDVDCYQFAARRVP